MQAHIAAAVEQKNHLLVLLLLKAAHNRFIDAGGGFPVDVADVVALLVVAQLMEILPLPQTR